MKKAFFAVLAVLLLAVAGINFWYFNSSAYFISHHWQHPLAAQGTPPAHFSELEASLSPQACGQCHVEQYQDWQQSLHSHTMQAGIQWQLRLMGSEEAKQCLNCHAPLAEQKALVGMAQNWPNAPQGALPHYVSEDLADQGLVCAACHVRNHQRFGPEPRISQLVSKAGEKAHDGFKVQSAFEQSEFCASCHQFADDSPRTAGKLRENTYQEWLASPYAAQGVQCQSCHMPDRKHQWQGIHSPSMVQQAVSAELVVENGFVRGQVTNSGAGHLFPTYMVPKVQVQLVYEEAGVKRLLAQKTLGWMVSNDLQTEEFDTRLAPMQSMNVQASLSAEFTEPIEQLEGKVLLQLEVQPDEHYQRIFTQSMGYADQLDATTLGLLQQALEKTKQSVFTVLLAEQRLKTL